MLKSSSMLPSLLFALLFPDVVVASDLKKNIRGSMDLAKKRHGTAHLHTLLLFKTE